MATAYADPADTLEDKYVKGLTKYKAEYDAKCRKFSLAYIASLKRLQVATVKKGDLDGALKVKAKIVELEKMLADNIPASLPKTPQSRTTTKTPTNIKWTKETFAGTTWESFDAEGKLLGELTYLPGGKIKGRTGGKDRSYWKWDFRNGKVYLGVSTTRGGMHMFSKDGRSSTNGNYTGKRDPGINKLKTHTLVGTWNWSGSVKYTFKADNTFITNTAVHGTWESLGNSKYAVRGVKNGSTFKNLVTLTGNTILITDIRGNKGVTRTRIAIDSITGSR